MLAGEQELDISEQLLLNGLGVVYRQGGAQYDGSISHWEELENAAIRHKKGIWVNGKGASELPSDYKKAAKGKNGKTADTHGKKEVIQAHFYLSRLTTRKRNSFT